MSGGSYDYLYCRDADELLASRYQLRHMAEDLASEFPGTRAAQDTQRLLEDLKTIEADIQARVKALGSVWKAQEWWQSGDSLRDAAEAAVTAYKTAPMRPLMTWVPA